MTNKVARLMRYPVKSMQGEDLDVCELTDRGIVGDRGYALVDTSDGRVVSAKNPRKWPGLLDYGARYIQRPSPRDLLPPVEILLRDGTRVRSDAPEAREALSQALSRPVEIATIPPADKTLEEFWPQVEGLTPIGAPLATEYGDTVTVLPISLLAPDGAFFDLAVIHLITTATLQRLQQLLPSARFDVRRFRPNFVVATDPEVVDFVENDWIGRELAIGDEVELKVIDPCPRCVMTTLRQDGLEADPAILRTIARHSTVASATLMPGEVMEACAGVYASVVRAGTVRRGDSVRFN